MNGGFLILIMIAFLFFYVLVIRPQRRRQTDQVTMQETLDIGDEIVTAGGMYGTVAAVDEDEVGVEIASGVVVRVARRAVAAVIPPPDEETGEEAGAGPTAEHEPESRSEAKLEKSR